MTFPSRPRAAFRCRSLSMVLAACTLVAPVWAREDPSVYISRVDSMAAAGPGTRAVEDVLFGPLAAMEPAPAWFAADRSRFIECLPGSPDWAEAESWLNGEPQREVLGALSTCTDVSGGTKWVLGIPYGQDAISSEWANAGLVATLEQDNLLATVEFPYFQRFETLADLATLEVYRLAADNQSEDALDTAIDLLMLGRFVADRPFAEESKFGYRLMSRALVVLRDAVYTYPDSFRDQEVLLDAIKDLDVNRVKNNYFSFPRAERIAAEQLMARTIAERGGVNTESFISTMATLTSADRPLRRFGEADRWRTAAAIQADWFDTQAAIDRIWGDFGKRWEYEFSRSEHARPTDYDQLASPQHRMVRQVAADVASVFAARRLVTAELGATRIALGCVAWKITRFDWPPGQPNAPLPLRPNYLRYVDDDPYHWSTRRDAFQPFGYFVPIRDEPRTERQEPSPHRVLASINPDRPYDSAFNQAAGLTMFGGTLTAMRDPGRGPASTRTSDMGSSGGGGDNPATALTDGLREYYDLEKGKIDPERYAEFLRSGGSADAIGSLQDFAMLLKVMDPAVTSSSVNWSSLVDRIISTVPPGAPPNASLRNGLTQIGIDPELFKRYLVSQFEAVMANPATRPVIAKLLDGTRPGLQDLMSARSMMDDILLREDLIEIQEQFITQALSGPMGDSVRALLAAESRFVAFPTDIDDSHFILYSIGPDRYDNRARNVGAEGDDIIYWPPLISLYRQSLSGGVPPTE